MVAPSYTLREYLNGFVNVVGGKVGDEVYLLSTVSGKMNKVEATALGPDINVPVEDADGKWMSGTAEYRPILDELVHVFNTDMTIDIFVDRIGQTLSENSPTTTENNTFFDVVDKFTVFLNIFGNFIDYEGTFGNDYAALKTKTDAVETAFTEYTSGPHPYPHDASTLLAAINAVKVQIHTIIYPKCKIVGSNNLKGALQTQFTALVDAVDENVAEDTLVTMPDANVCTEFGVI